jgi:hypothetical protein
MVFAKLKTLLRKADETLQSGIASVGCSQSSAKPNASITFGMPVMSQNDPDTL